MKKIVIIGFIIFLLCGCQKKNEEISSNVKDGVIQDQVIAELTMTQTSLIYQNKESILTTTIQNKTQKEIYIKGFYIHVKDKSGNIIITLMSDVDETIQPGSNQTIISKVAKNILDAEIIEYEVIS